MIYIEIVHWSNEVENQSVDSLNEGKDSFYSLYFKSDGKRTMFLERRKGEKTDVNRLSKCHHHVLAGFAKESGLVTQLDPSNSCLDHTVSASFGLLLKLNKYSPSVENTPSLSKFAES